MFAEAILLLEILAVAAVVLVFAALWYRRRT